QRIVSLLPSATEIVCRVGGRGRLVGVSHECDFSAGVDRLPALTRPRFEMPRASDAIDRAVRETLRDALAVYEVDIDRLRDLDPDLVVTQDLCDVCAVSLDDVTDALRALSRDDVDVVSLKPTRLADVWADVRRVGEAIGEPDAGAGAAAELAARCRSIAARAAELPTRPSVLSIEWLSPVMVGGTWMPELIELAGGAPLVTKPGEHAPTLDRAALEALDPDVVLIKPCGFELERTFEELDLLERNLPWRRWRAVREGRVFIADGNAFFNRPGPRLVESLEILAACVHPEAFADFRRRHVDSFVAVDARLATSPVAAG
ncbi:MAG: ABC transporter substrate-binding protein, partial [Acidobacteriota bacterium]